jgi:penicillin-binding protein 1A
MLLSLFITLIVAASILYIYLDKQLPDVDELKSVQLPIPMRIYTSDGQAIAEFGELHRNLVKLNEVPNLMVKAFLATEDQRFLEHHGVDFYGLLRAATEVLLTGSKVQGGSTITMQVARNFYLSREKTFLRKFTEILLSLKIEREFTKEQILELYLNKIFLGNRAYGVAAAAQVYFNKTLNQLTLPEMATIAGLPKAPSAINPLINPIAAKQRRDHVLTRMFELGYISKASYETAIATPMLTQAQTDTGGMIKAPYVAEMVRDMMYKSFGEDSYLKGYNVYTTINSAQQLAANKALRTSLLAYDKRHGYRGTEKNIAPLDANKVTHTLNSLHRASSINGLQAAIIIAITDQVITALLVNNQMIFIPWQGLAWTIPQLANNALNPPPETLKNKVHVGDVIRVQETQNNTWELSQIPKVQGALVALNPQTGAISALVGGFDYNLSKFNRVIQAERQPGSGFKPFIYAAALAKGYTLANIFNDAPLVFDIPGRDEPWRPQNDNHIFSGPTRLRVALAKSINLVSVRLLQAIDVPYVLTYVKRFGFNAKKLPRNLSLALGTGEVTPIELARAYAVFANGGYRITPYLIDHITNEQGQTIYKAEPKIACEACLRGEIPPPSADGKESPYAPQVIPADIAFLTTSALKDVIQYGTGSQASILNRHDLAGKTGTTSDYIDTWFTGFNSNLVATVWIGFDQPNSVLEYGSKAALPMWINFMRVALQGQPEKTMPQPSDIVTASIDPISGNLLPSGTPGSILECFRKDDLLRAPIQEDSVTFNTTDNSNTVTDPTENPTQSETKPQSNKEAGEPLF